MSQRRYRSFPLVAVAAVVAALATLVAAPAAPAEGEPTVTQVTIESPADKTPIAFTVFQPAGTGPGATVPVIFDSHGWAGSRRSGVDGTVTAFIAGGFGMVSVDQRGHGASGGEANIQDPDLEAQDIKGVIDYVAELNWVSLDAPGDPVLGAIGGSYGGGYQLITALQETRESGSTRFDALAPEITWHDLPNSLAPDRVPRTVWVSALYAAGAPMLPMYVHQGFAEGLATGTLSETLATELYEHSPKAFSDDGFVLDVPTLMRQGTSDNLFNLNQGWHNFESVLSDRARALSRFVGYNGGHVLPNVLPPGFATDGDACSPGSFQELTVGFFQHALLGRGQSVAATLPRPYNLTTADGDACLTASKLDDRTTIDIPMAVTTVGAGVPQHIALAEGPISVAGIPQIEATLTAAGVEARAFVALSVGLTPADAQVVQNNVLPIRRLLPVTGEPIAYELPGVAVEVPEGETLFLTISPLSDMFIGHGSRTPGAMLFEEVSVGLPNLKALD